MAPAFSVNSAMNRDRGAVLKSFVESANARGCPFPVQNLPFGVFSTASDPGLRVGVAIGDFVLDLACLEANGLMGPSANAAVFDKPSLNAFMTLGPSAWAEVRERLSALLNGANPELRDDPIVTSRCLVPLAAAELHLPIAVAGFTDFYSSKEHATNAGRMFRGPDNPLPPNWSFMPIAYNGRASSVVVSGTPIGRPLGQTKPNAGDPPAFGPCRKLDFELEVGTVVGQASELGRPVSIRKAQEMIFGYVLLNDWSARDIQQWESAPLGPFQAKVFATSISPWVVTRTALEPFRVEGPKQDPEPLAYLRQDEPRNLDLYLEVALRPSGQSSPTTICRTNFKHMYWSSAQQLAHHAIGGCNMQIGDLLGSGTVSGSGASSFGSLLELTWNGSRPLDLGEGIWRTFIEDCDEVIMTGWCQGDGYRVGFGEVAGEVVSARNVDGYSTATGT